MKKIWITLSLLTLVYSNHALCQLNSDDYAAQTLLAEQMEAGEEPLKPFSFSATFDIAGKADFKQKRCHRKLHDVQFAIAEVNGSTGFYYNPACKEGLIASAGYSYTRIKWDNPYITQDHFNTVNVAIAGFTHRTTPWTWSGQVQVNADVDHFSLSNYVTYNLILAGRYACNECVGLHAGFIALTGMKIDRVYPIIGIDWQINEDWKLNLVFPLNVSLLYAIDKEWSIGIAGRGFEERYRIGKQSSSRLHRKYSRGLVEYRATGVEAGVYYTSCDESLQGNLHVGELIGGTLKISNEQHKESHRFRFRSAPYIGGDIAYHF